MVPLRRGLSGRPAGPAQAPGGTAQGRPEFMVRGIHSGAIGRAALQVLLAAACFTAVACGGESTITPAWRKVDSCLEQGPSFLGNVVVEKGGPVNAIDSLSVDASGGALANAYCFPSAADARSAEEAIGPPGRQ
jgi:hypothetical protein